jgi:hypothetical protein
MTIPLIIIIAPLIQSELQKQFPEEIAKSNPFFIVFSPYLDKESIDSGKNASQILENAIDIGTRPIVRSATTPVLSPIRTFIDTIGEGIKVFQEVIQEGVSAPVRGMYMLSNTFIEKAGEVIRSFLSAGAGMLTKMRQAMDIIATLILNVFYSIMNAKLTIQAIFNFFINIGRGVTNVIFIIASLFVLMIFSPASIVLGVLLFTTGGVLRGLIEMMYHTMNI